MEIFLDFLAGVLLSVPMSSYFFMLLAALLSIESKAVRLVSASPQVTEIIFQLGKQKHLVAVSQGSEYPEPAKQLPRIGSVFLPGVETIVRLTPDWVISDSQTQNPIVTRGLKTLGISRFQFDIPTVDSLFSEAARFLSTVYNESPTAALKPCQDCVSRLPSTGRSFRFLLFAWPAPAILFGHRTYLSDLLKKLGGENLLPAHWPQPFPQVAEEWLLKRVPDIVYYLEDEQRFAKEAVARLVKRWRGQGKIRVVALPTEFFGRASFTPLFHLEKLGLEGLNGEICRAH